VPAGSDDVVIPSGGGLMVSDNAFVAPLRSFAIEITSWLEGFWQDVAHKGAR
jgi:hypothetical protein